MSSAIPFRFHSNAARLIALLLVMLATRAHGLTVCASDAQTLQNELQVAAATGVPMTIHLEQGTYALHVPPFLFTQPITVSGGFLPGQQCQARVADPHLTVIDLGGAGSPTNAIDFNTTVEGDAIDIDGVTIRNGRYVWLSTLGINHDYGSNIRVRNSVIDHIAGFGPYNNPPVTMQLDTGTGTFEQVLFHDISVNSGCEVWIYTYSGVAQVNYVTAALSQHDLCLGGDLGSHAEVANSIIFAPLNSRGLSTDVGSARLTNVHYSHFAPADVQNVIETKSISWPTVPGWDASFRLTQNSPDVNSAAFVEPMGTPSTDIEAHPRKIGSSPDRGAFESPWDDTAVYTVTSLSDTAPNDVHTLRGALLAANTPPHPATIKFDLHNQPGSCPRKITLQSALPDIYGSVFIDGYSEPGAHANTATNSFDAAICVAIVPAAPMLSAFRVPATTGANQPNDAASLTVRGLAFGGFGEALRILGGHDNTVVGNQFGGKLGQSAVELETNTVGVYVGLDGSSGSMVIGGDDAPARNLFENAVSTNFTPGRAIDVSGFDSSNGDCQITNNLIGFDRDGVSAAPNTYGIRLSGSGCAVARNRVGNSVLDAIAINGDHNHIFGNILGVDAVGNGAGSDGAAIRINGSGNVIDGGNTIRGNQLGGVVVTNGTGNTIRGNVMMHNGLGAFGAPYNPNIDLGFDGPTSNDPADADSGPNALQNSPVITSLAADASGKTPARIVFALDSNPGTYKIDAYWAPDCGAGVPQASVYLGGASVVLPGTAEHVDTLLPTSTGYVSLTATAPDGSTSEMSSCWDVDRIFAGNFEK